jgi:hypothetical protein
MNKKWAMFLGTNSSGHPEYGLDCELDVGEFQRSAHLKVCFKHTL